ncbi:histidine kinase dimerization/phospho-acceptor domain-containing protein, partial [Kaarinaea lacus]
MYTLFWKIFFTYWLIILIIELFTAWITADLSEHEFHPILERQNAEFVASSTQAVSILTSDGLAGLRSWILQESNLKGIDEIYVIDKNNKEVNNQPLPDSIKVIAKNNDVEQTPYHHYQPIKHTLAFRTKTPEGDNYLVISTFAHPPLLKYLLAPQRVALSVIISGLICFLLARYFTSPLINLRRSTQMLTLGDFDTTHLQQLRNRSDEFGALAVDFNQMTERLSDLLHTQRQLLRDISHELYSPLARIRVALGLARKKYIALDSAELDRIEAEIEKLEILIRELLTFVKIDPKNNTTNTTQVNICELLSYVVTDAQYEQQQSSVDQKINLQCSDNIEIDVDAKLLHRAIENILRNAR